MQFTGLIGIACFVAWLTHIFTCFSHAMWGFLVAGAIFFPIGVLHGFYLWFSYGVAMWDVLVTVILMGFGAFMVIVLGAVFIAALFYMQNGGRDD